MMLNKLIPILCLSVINYLTIVNPAFAENGIEQTDQRINNDLQQVNKTANDLTNTLQNISRTIEHISADIQQFNTNSNNPAVSQQSAARTYLEPVKPQHESTEPRIKYHHYSHHDKKQTIESHKQNVPINQAQSNQQSESLFTRFINFVRGT